MLNLSNDDAGLPTWRWSVQYGRTKMHAIRRAMVSGMLAVAVLTGLVGGAQATVAYPGGGAPTGKWDCYTVVEPSGFIGVRCVYHPDPVPAPQKPGPKGPGLA